MAPTDEQDYVLGTHDEELQRLGLQHRVWRPAVLDCWRRAGITVGSRVLDVGCGPGYATLDLAELVEQTGRVVGVERSASFLAAAEAACRARGLAQASFHQLDLMKDPLPAGPFDAAWVRWVATFVSSPATLIEKLAEVVRPGGVAIFHEYVAYSSLRVSPYSRPIEEFVDRVMQSWRNAGGEPDVALALPQLLAEAGFTLRSAEPRVFCVGPRDHIWRWPATFIDINLRRLVELGEATEAWAETVRRDLADREANPHAFMITQMVLEMIAQRDR